MRPAGSARGANVAFSPRDGHGDAEAVRPDEPRAVGAHEREQPLLAGAALRAELGEPGGDHAERAHSVAERRRGRIEHLLAGEADDGEVDEVGDLVDRAVGANAGDGLALEVHRVGGAREVGRRGCCGRARRRSSRAGARRR